MTNPTKPIENPVSGHEADPVWSADLLAAAAGMGVAHDNVVPFSTRKAWRDDG
jgi:hypothetical protein